jgi:hypothetical protein
MPNVNAPFGARLLNSEGKQFRVNRYVKKSGAAIFEGDFVIQDATGTVTIAGATGTLLGVAMEYKASADVSEIAVCDDPEAVFEIQASANLVQTDVLSNAQIVATAGSTSLNRAQSALDSANIATDATHQLKILGKSEIDDNAYGSYCRAKVKINNHAFKAGVAGV